MRGKALMSLSFEGGRNGQIQLSLSQFMSPDTGVSWGLFLPKPSGRYKAVFRLINSGISSHGQGVEDYTSCFKNHLCYRLVFKIFASAMFVFFMS